MHTPGRWTLAFSTIASGELDVGGGVHVDVAHALVVLDHRDARVLGDVADQALAAARDAEIDQVVELHQLGDRLAIGHRHQLDGLDRQLAR